MKQIKIKGFQLGMALVYILAIGNPPVILKSQSIVVQKPNKKHYIEKKKLDKNVFYFKKNLAHFSTQSLVDETA